MATATECTCTYPITPVAAATSQASTYQNFCLHWLRTVHSMYQEEACYPLMVWATVLGEVVQPLLKETHDYLYNSVHDDGGRGGSRRGLNRITHLLLLQVVST